MRSSGWHRYLPWGAGGLAIWWLAVGVLLAKNAAKKEGVECAGIAPASQGQPVPRLVDLGATISPSAY